MRRAKGVIYTVCAILILFAVWNLRSLRQSEANAEKLRQELSAVAHPQASGATSASADVTAGTAPDVLNGWIDELYAMNHDLLGWLTVPDTVIDYPVTQTDEDNDFYLTHDFNGRADAHGTLFADVNSRLGEGKNLIIYGHHMVDGTMFQNLMKFRSPEFCRSGGETVFYTRNYTRRFAPAAVMVISADEARDFPYYACTDFDSADEYESFFSQVNDYALWMADELPDYPTMLMTLSTCEYSKEDGRLVVIFQCVEEETASER